MTDDPASWKDVEHFFVLVERMQRFFRERTAEFGLTPAAANVLVRLRPGASEPMSQLARRLGQDPGNLTGVVDHLERAGLVHRRPSATDGRSREVELTADGVARRAEVVARTLDGTPLARGLTPDERRLLSGLLGVLAHPADDVQTL